MIHSTSKLCHRKRVRAATQFQVAFAGVYHGMLVNCVPGGCSPREGWMMANEGTTCANSGQERALSSFRIFAFVWFGYLVTFNTLKFYLPYLLYIIQCGYGGYCTGNGTMGQPGCTGRGSPFGLFFHFRCVIHPIHTVDMRKRSSKFEPSIIK